ncbi:RNA processing protein [Malassezia obtusa]|uniref:LSM complex subunit LSM4 n=1 Tax=Malassezia obtusa TaxID=76774 RepID=A0AAF0E1Y7_9BASI|nr:RNA processing protein [Malassezia obtusa]
MLPLTLLNAAQNKPILVELKNGETFNGHLQACDNFMNVTLKDVYQTSASGEQFWKMDECYIKGSTIKYCRVADALIDAVRESEEHARKQRQAAAGHGRDARGRGDGQRGRGRGARAQRA